MMTKGKTKGGELEMPQKRLEEEVMEGLPLLRVSSLIKEFRVRLR
jgi:hypothetical protein